MAENRAERRGGPAGEPRAERGDERPARTVPLVDRVRDRVSAELNARKDRATEVLDDLAGTVRRLGEPLHDEPLGALGGYADQVAARIERVATDMRERDVTELADDLRDIARRHPAAFAAAGFTAGLLATRFLKSSAPVTRGDEGHGARKGRPAAPGHPVRARGASGTAEERGAKRRDL